MLQIELKYYYQYDFLALLSEARLIPILICTPEICCQVLPKVVYLLDHRT